MKNKYWILKFVVGTVYFAVILKNVVVLNVAREEFLYFNCLHWNFRKRSLKKIAKLYIVDFNFIHTNLITLNLVKQFFFFHICP